MANPGGSRPWAREVPLLEGVSQEILKKVQEVYTNGG